MYLILINSTQAEITAFHSYLKRIYNREIMAWWHHIPGGFYLVISTLEAGPLSDAIRKGLPDKTQVLVMEVNAPNSEGFLPRRAWNWINSKGASSEGEKK